MEKNTENKGNLTITDGTPLVESSPTVPVRSGATTLSKQPSVEEAAALAKAGRDPEAAFVYSDQIRSEVESEIERPRPAPGSEMGFSFGGSLPVGAIPQYEVADPGDRLPSLEQIKKSLGAELKVLSRRDCQSVADDIMKGDPDDLKEFVREFLDRLFGKEIK